jgi:hypothetical protein
MGRIDMTKDEIREMRCDMHKGVKMFNQELEEIARSKKEFSWDEMMKMSDILKDMSEVEKNLAKADYYDRKTS